MPVPSNEARAKNAAKFKLRAKTTMKFIRGFGVAMEMLGLGMSIYDLVTTEVGHFICFLNFYSHVLK